MKISLVASDPTQGLLHYPSALGQALSLRGHDVQLLTWGSREQQDGLRRNAERSGAKVVSTASLARSGLRALLLPARDLRAAVSSFGTEILHTYGPVAAFQATGAARRTVVMVAAMGHDRRSRFPAMAGAVLLNCVADAVVAQCEAEIRRLTSAGVHAAKLTRVLNPVDCDATLAAARRRSGVALQTVRRALDPGCTRLVGCFANFQLRKRHALLLRGFAAIARDLADVGLVLAGEGPELDASRQFVMANELERRVCFLGRLPVEDSLGLLADVDVVVHPSVAETFGYSLVEPLLLDKPLVAARTGVAFELEGLPGVHVVDPDDEAAFGRALRSVLEPGAAPRLHGRIASEWVRNNCDVGVVAERLERLYEHLLRGA